MVIADFELPMPVEGEPLLSALIYLACIGFVLYWSMIFSFKPSDRADDD